ncbi:MAG: hypothetical protein IIC74_07960 [Bacteroidetes bacterium]|nr:hypothetical protein [Bacteroidota bacterium]
MISIRRFEYSSDKQITTQKADEINNFLWVAFAQNSSGNVIIEKQAKFFPTQTYFSLEREVTEVNAMDLDSSNLYVSYIDSTLLGEIISKTNPLTNTTIISKGSFIESPVDVKVNSSDLWFLLPGNASGTNSKLLKYNTSGTFIQEVDLINSLTVVNASTMTIDDNNDIWIGTFTNPATVVRVFEISGGLFDFEVTQII